MPRVRDKRIDEKVVWLREKGLTIKQVAEQVGIGTTTVKRILDPGYAARALERSRRIQRRGRCLDCGKKISSNYSRPSKRCHKCAGRYLAEQKRIQDPLMKKRRSRLKKLDSRRDEGCIVTLASRTTGDTRVYHRWGPMPVVLEIICNKATPDQYVASISTYRSIMRDLSSDRLWDPFQVERNALGGIGRLDLLDPRALTRQSDHASAREKRLKDAKLLKH